VWELSLAETPVWFALTPAEPLPPTRLSHTAIYDPARDRMVVFGGGDFSSSNDVWALSLVGTTAWAALTPAGPPPPERHRHTAIYDPGRDRMVIFGGQGGNNNVLNDVWALNWVVQAAVPTGADAFSRGFELAPPRPNPSRGETFVDFELAHPDHVVLDVFDVRGRRVKRITDEWFTAGRHVSMWQGDDDRGHALGSGVYFIRMQTGGLQTTRRTALVR
jgi:hypothetical protein